MFKTKKHRKNIISVVFNKVSYTLTVITTAFGWICKKCLTNYIFNTAIILWPKDIFEIHMLKLK